MDTKVTDLITCNELNKLIDSGAANIQIFETRMVEKKQAQDQFLSKHIPLAQYFDLWEGVTASHLMPKNLPDPDKFAEYAQNLGINNNTHVILYDYEMSYAARLWYQFKAFGHDMVSVLDGGLPYWITQGFPVESGHTEEKVHRGNFEIRKEKTTLFKEYNNIIEEFLPNSVQILDVRNPVFFRGTNTQLPKELISALQFAGLPSIPDPDKLLKGHLPSSVNIENKTFIDKDTNCMVTKEQLLEMFGAVSLDINKPLLVTCYLGVTACLVPLAASRLQQHGEMTIYGGSWTEYSQKSSHDNVETGPAK